MQRGGELSIQKAIHDLRYKQGLGLLMTTLGLVTFTRQFFVLTASSVVVNKLKI